MSVAPRNAALDGLRGLAILLVIPHNANLWDADPGPWWPLAVLANAGWIGVQLFFVLSGFLITGGLLDARGGEHYFRNFYLRRALRILPLYYLVLTIGLLAGPVLIGQPPLNASERAGIPWLWLFLSNWVQPHGLAVPGFTHFWSLAVEEQFYLVWPLAVLALGRGGLLGLCATLAAAAMLLRLALPALGAPPEAGYVYTFCRMDALAAGASAAVLLRSGAAAWLRSPARLAALALLALAAGALATHVYDRHDWRTLSFGEPLLAGAFAALILALARARHDERIRWLAWLEARPLRAAGRYSYGMYVLHLPIVLALLAPGQGWLAFAGRSRPALFALLVLVLSVTAGWLSYVLLERRFLAMKSHFGTGARGMRRGTGVAAG